MWSNLKRHLKRCYHPAEQEGARGVSVTIWERRGVACSALVACSHHSVKNAEGHKQVPNRQHEASWYETRIDLRPHQIAVVETTLRLVAVPAKVENLLCSAVQARALLPCFRDHGGVRYM